MNKTPEQMAEKYCNQFSWNDPREEDAHDAFLAGYQAAELKAKMEFAAKYDHNSPLQVIAAEYVKRRGTIGPLALLEENRFIDGYEAGMNSPKKLDSWISVKDRLPEKGVGWTTVYGCILSRWAVQPGFYTKDSGVWVSRFVDQHEDYHNYLPFESVTHWMPLPAAPREEV